MKMLQRLLLILGLLTLAGGLGLSDAKADDGVPNWKVHLISSCTIADVPSGAFVPDRAFIPGSTSPEHNQVFVQLPVNFGIIQHGNEVVLFDSGIQPSTDRFPFKNLVDLINCKNWVSIVDQLAQLHIRPGDVTKIVVGHGHWDHAGQLDKFPNAVLFIQGEEVRGIEFALGLPFPLNRVNTDPPATSLDGVTPLPAGCARTPACGYPPQTVAMIMEKIARNKAVIVEGSMEIAPGLIIHPVFRSHTAGSQLLQVNTNIGQVLFGSDTYSSWTGMKRFLAANIQQTDTVQQFLAYEKCFAITGPGLTALGKAKGFIPGDLCVSAHEPLSYTPGYPLTEDLCPGVVGIRCAVIAD